RPRLRRVSLCVDPSTGRGSAPVASLVVMGGSSGHFLQPFSLATDSMALAMALRPTSKVSASRSMAWATEAVAPARQLSTSTTFAASRFASGTFGLMSALCRARATALSLSRLVAMLILLGGSRSVVRDRRRREESSLAGGDEERGRPVGARETVGQHDH